MQQTLFPVALGLICSSLTCPAQENLVQNPGFEAATVARGLPGGGWWLYEGRGSTEVKVDPAVAHSGKAAVGLHSNGEAKSVLVSSRFTVAPGDQIRFEAWLRGENLPTNRQATASGLAFRRADGTVFERAYFRSEPLSGTWSLVSGTATTPAEAVSAEVHLSYTNAPGAIWFDDVSAVITSPLSLSLVSGPKPWPGEQPLTVLVVNRAASPFAGGVVVKAGRQTNAVPVMVGPKASRELPISTAFNSVGAHEYSVSLLDAAGAPVRVLRGSVRTLPPLVLYPACPCYHVVGEGNGDTRLDARVNLNPAQRTGLRLSVELTDGGGQPLRTETADAAKGDTVGLSLKIPILAPGSFRLAARLVDAAGQEIARADTDVRVCARSQARVEIGPDGFLRVGGTPQFPIGMYSCGRYEEMGRAGFTGTHNYGITTGDADEAINPNDAHLETLLEASWTNGMRMMVELPRKAIEKAQWAQVRRRIETFRHHPGLLCWGSEERVARGTAPLTHIAALYRLVRELDPDHPLVLGDTKDVIQKFEQDRRDFFPDACMDAGIWWWYPIPLKEPDGNGVDGAQKSGLMEPPSWLTSTHSKKPLWIAIQAYQKPNPGAGFPTPAEYRCQAYLSVISGVKGLWFYTGSGQKDYQGKPAGLLNKPAESHWDYVQALVGELRQLSPVMLAPKAAARIERSPTDAPVEFTTREFEGKFYLLAANKSERSQTVRFTGAVLRGRKPQVLFESHRAELEGESLTDEFLPLGVHVYRFD